MNKIFLTGRLGQEPQEFGKDTKGYNFSLAVSEYNKKKDDYDTHWVRVTTFSKQAPYLAKGDSVLLEGKVQENKWEKEGQKFSQLQVLASSVHKLQAKGSSESQSKQQSQRSVSDDFGF